MPAVRRAASYPSRVETEHQRVGRAYEADSAMSKGHTSCATVTANDCVIDIQIRKFARRLTAAESNEWHLAFQQIFNPRVFRRCPSTCSERTDGQNVPEALTTQMRLNRTFVCEVVWPQRPPQNQTAQRPQGQGLTRFYTKLYRQRTVLLRKAYCLNSGVFDGIRGTQMPLVERYIGLQLARFER